MSPINSTNYAAFYLSVSLSFSFALSSSKLVNSIALMDMFSERASVESRLVLPFLYWLTRVVPDKGPLNGCVCVSGANAAQVPAVAAMADESDDADCCQALHRSHRLPRDRQ